MSIHADRKASIARGEAVWNPTLSGAARFVIHERPKVELRNMECASSFYLKTVLPLEIDVLDSLMINLLKPQRPANMQMRRWAPSQPTL